MAEAIVGEVNGWNLMMRKGTVWMMTVEIMILVMMALVEIHMRLVQLGRRALLLLLLLRLLRMPPVLLLHMDQQRQQLMFLLMMR